MYFSNFVVESLKWKIQTVKCVSLMVPYSSIFDLCVMKSNVPMWNSGWYSNIEGLPSTQISSRIPRPHCRLPPVKSRPLLLMDNGSSAAQFLELDNKGPWYIELSASPALVPVCIGCSLYLQLSAWGGTVNDVFVLCSPFVLSWFLEQHKQAWNLFYPPRKKWEASKSACPQFSDEGECIWSLFCSSAPSLRRFYL